MQPLDFLAAVLPTEGVYCVAELSSKKKEHVFATSLAELDATLGKFNERKLNTFFALATFATPGSRTADNAQYMRALFIDLDCDEDDPKKYPDQQAALDALGSFLADTELDKLCAPWIVSSGGGIHAYWPFDTHVPIDRWKPVAEGFKRLCQKAGLKIDYTVTADAARVLRVPGSTNWKRPMQPRPVKILQECAPAHIPFDVLAAHVKERLNGEAAPQAAFALPGRRPTRIDTAVNVKLVENSTTVFKNIVSRSASGTGCAQVVYYLENAADDGMEPLWRGLLSLAKECVDADKATRKLSSLHPYDEERMRRKLAEIKGPYPCTKLDSENPGVCEKCPHWGKITNPLALGRELVTDNAPKEIAAPTAPDAPPVAGAPAPIMLQRPQPPKGFSYGKNGGVYVDKVDEDAGGNVVKRQVLVLPYDLFVVDLLNLQGDHTVHMLALRPDGSVQITLSQKAVVSKDETVKALAAQNVIAAFGSGNDKNLFDYVRACVEEASSTRAALRVPDSYGWQKNHSFVTASKIFYPDGTTRASPMPGLDNLHVSTLPSGTLEGWRSIVAMLLHKKYNDVLAVGLGVAFGSPLMTFAKGLHGLTIHAASTPTGTGKSIALNLAASVWGDPQEYRVNPSTSKVAMQQHAGLLRSLPLVSDEITNKTNEDFEWFPQFVFDISQGKGKERMEAGANKERLNTTRWSLLAFLSSNSHALDYLSGARKHSSQGQLYRLLEWTTNQKLEFNNAEIESLQAFTEHYGVAGQMYASWLASNRATAQSVFREVYEHIGPKFNFSSDERYWRAGIACMIAGYILAGPQYAGIIELPVGIFTKCLQKIVERNRSVSKSSVRSAEDVLNSYIREYYGRFVVVRALDGAMQATLGERGTIDETITRTQVAGRVEHNVTPGHVHLFIEEQLLKSYCSSVSFGYTDFKEQVKALGLVDIMKKDMLAKTKGPPMRVNAIRISRPVAEAEDLIKLPEEGDAES